MIQEIIIDTPLAVNAEEMSQENSKTVLAVELTPNRKMVKVTDLPLHELYERLVGAMTVKKFHADGVKEFGHIGIPRINASGKVISHYQEVLAAQVLGKDQIEVEVVDISDDIVPQFMLYANLLQEKQHAAVSIAIDYLTDYFKTDIGKKWANTIPGDKEEKLAYIFGSRPSTIKQFLSIAKNHREHLNLVQEGNMTWAELRKMVSKKSPSYTVAAPVEEKGDAKEGSNSVIDPTKTLTEPVVQSQHNSSHTSFEHVGEEDAHFGGEVDEEEYYSEDEDIEGLAGNYVTSPVSVTADIANYEFSEASFTLTNGMVMKITTTDSGKELTVDGKKINATYMYRYDLGDDGNTEYYSTIFNVGDMGAASFQLIFDQPKNMLAA